MKTICYNLKIMLNHLAVLLRKDVLTLKRNWVYLVMFIMLPVTMMYGFWQLETYIDRVLTPEKHNVDKVRYTRKDMIWTQFMGAEIWQRELWDTPTWTPQSSMWGCGAAGRHDIGLVAPPALNKGIRAFLEKGIAGHITEGLKLWAFETQEDLFYNVRTNMSREYCFGLEISDIRPGVKEANITMLIPRELAQDTYKPLVDWLQFTPDWYNWNFTS